MNKLVCVDTDFDRQCIAGLISALLKNVCVLVSDGDTKQITIKMQEKKFQWIILIGQQFARTAQALSEMHSKKKFRLITDAPSSSTVLSGPVNLRVFQSKDLWQASCLFLEKFIAPILIQYCQGILIAPATKKWSGQSQFTFQLDPRHFQLGFRDLAKNDVIGTSRSFFQGKISYEHIVSQGENVACQTNIKRPALPLHLATQLKSEFEREFSFHADDDPVKYSFCIQHTAFSLEKKCPTRHNPHWHFKTSECLYLDCLHYEMCVTKATGKQKTKITIDNRGVGPVIRRNFYDHRGSSNLKGKSPIVYTVDLFPDYKPMFFRGTTFYRNNRDWVCLNIPLQGEALQEGSDASQEMQWNDDSDSDDDDSKENSENSEESGDESIDKSKKMVDQPQKVMEGIQLSTCDLTKNLKPDGLD